MAKLRIATFLFTQNEDADFPTLVDYDDIQVIEDHGVEYPDPNDAVKDYAKIKKALGAD